MKKITLLALILTLFVGVSNAQTKINWLKITDVEKQIKKDGKNAKRVFIDCYTDWCGWCKRMDKDTFEDPTIAMIMNYYFYSVKFDAETKENITFGGKEYKNANPNGRRSAHELAIMLLNQRLSYPSFSILNSDLSIATIIPGYYTAKDFEPMIVFMGGKYEEKYSFEEFQKQYETKIKKEVMAEITKAQKAKK
jgi:thioredoxin-related protein